MPRVRVYVGPTLAHDDARRLLDAEYRPPITEEDLGQALADGVEIVGIIDGTFVMPYTATPTQILECLRQGMILYGAASAGALRAVETDRFGMRGIGGIYRLYKAGFDAEDELAVVYDPETLRPLSEPMINVRYALSHGVAEGVIDREVHDRLLAIAKKMYFAQRTYPYLYKVARNRVPEVAIDAFRRFVTANGERLDWKRRDAIACLRAIGTCAESLGSSGGSEFPVGRHGWGVRAAEGRTRGLPEDGGGIDTESEQTVEQCVILYGPDDRVYSVPRSVLDRDGTRESSAFDGCPLGLDEEGRDASGRGSSRPEG